MNTMQAKKVCALFGYDGDFTIYHDNVIFHIDGEHKAIRKAEYNKDRIEFINELKEHIYNNGFHNIDRYYKFNEIYYVELNSELYYMCDWILANEITTYTDKELKKAMETLAQLHIAGNGFKASENVKIKNEIGKLPNLLTKRTNELLKMKKIASTGKDKFDYLFLQVCDLYINRAFETLKCLKSDSYYSVVERAILSNEICHRDYSYYNLTFMPDSTYVTNFDYACYEMNVYDIATFLRKIMCDTLWDNAIYDKALSYYDSIKKISANERQIIKALVTFPQRFWRVTNRYYNRRKSCPDNGYYIKLQEICENREKYEKFE